MKKETVRIERVQDVYNVISIWAKRPEENFLCVTLNGAHEVIRVNHITKGLVNKTIIHPRECFRPALIDRATSVILAHNHPSGYVFPSNEDDKITETMCMAADVMGINLLDHVIIAVHNQYYSYSAAGKIRHGYNHEDLINFTNMIAAETWIR